MSAVADEASLYYSLQAAHTASDGCYTTPQAYGDPTDSGATLRHSQSAYSLQSDADPRLYPTLEPYHPSPSQTTLNARVSTGPAAYTATDGRCTAPEAYGDPTASGATLRQSQSVYSLQLGAAHRLYPTLESYHAAAPQTTLNVTVSTEPTLRNSLDVLRRNGISTYVICSFINLIVCCLPLGIAAFTYSIQVYLAATDAAAKRHSRKARAFNIAATSIGFLLIAGGLAYLFLGDVVTWTRSNVPSREPTMRFVIPAALEVDN